jgi:voltage-gated potassium channel
MYRALFKRFFWPLALLVAIIVIGTLGYWFMTGQQYNLLDTFYMTLITISTIGFGEVIDISLIPAARIFTIFIAIAGIGILFYMITNLTALIVEGELTKSFRRGKMEKKARDYQDHYIICGSGGLGQHIAAELAATRRPYVIIDNDKAAIEKVLGEGKDRVVIEGDATDNATLEKAGIQRARGLFAALGDDNNNLVVILTARQLNPAVRVVSRCNDLKNSDKMRKAGADSIISPFLIGGLRMASEMIRPAVVTFLDKMLRDGEKNLRVEEVTVPDALAGSTIASLRLDRYPSILLVAVRIGEDWTYNPPADSVIRPGSTLIFIGGPEDRRKLEHELAGA